MSFRPTGAGTWVHVWAVVVVIAVVAVVATSVGVIALRPAALFPRASSPPTYAVSFNEAGLPAKTSWWVSVAGTSHTSAGPTIVVNLTSGTYPYIVGPVAGYVTAWTGTLTVGSVAEGLSVPFVPYTYTVTFSESGLPAGTDWSVALGTGAPAVGSTSTFLNLTEPNGSYPFAIGGASGYAAAPSGGTVQVDGANVSEPIAFSENGTSEPVITIGGSSAAYPFTQLGVSWYVQNDSDIVISDDQGGTGAGMLAVCAGHLEVGVAAQPETAAELEADDGCPSTDDITNTTFGYDAVDVVVPAANPHGLLSLGWDTLTAIYDGASTTAPTLLAPSIDTVPLSSGPLDQAPWSTHAALDWDQIPATVDGYSFPAGSLYDAGAVATTTATVEGLGSVSATGAVACGASSSDLDDLCDASVFGASASGTPCGFLVCAGGAASGSDNATATIAPFEREDASGTTATFEARLLGAANNSTFAASYANLGWAGCGPNDLLADCGILLPPTEQANGAAGILSAVAADANAIGYAPDGPARSATGIGAAGLVPFLAVGESLAPGDGLVAGSELSYGAVVPTTGAAGSLSAGIHASGQVSQYAGWRPFVFVTLEPPTGQVQDLFTFLLDPEVNLQLAAATGELSLYTI